MARSPFNSTLQNSLLNEVSARDPRLGDNRQNLILPPRNYLHILYHDTILFVHCVKEFARLLSKRVCTQIFPLLSVLIRRRDSVEATQKINRTRNLKIPDRDSIFILNEVWREREMFGSIGR